MQNRRLDDLLSAQNNTKLIEDLKIIQPRTTTGSLASYDDLEFADLVRFREIYQLEVENTITGAELYPGEMISPKKISVGLPDDVYRLLSKYYNMAYNDFEFFTIGELLELSRNPGRFDPSKIVILPQVDQFGRVRIGSEVFGSIYATRYLKNSYILAKFIQNDGNVETYPGQVQYYFEHKVMKKIHRLAFVKWFVAAPNSRIRFHFQIEQLNNIEVWKNEFYEIGRDCIIPIHNILGRFIPCYYEIGKRTPIKYMAVIPIGRKFHI
jgi:hypothetical protein